MNAYLKPDSAASSQVGGRRSDSCQPQEDQGSCHFNKPGMQGIYPAIVFFKAYYLGKAHPGKPVLSLSAGHILAFQALEEDATGSSSP